MFRCLRSFRRPAEAPEVVHSSVFIFSLSSVVKSMQSQKDFVLEKVSEGLTAVEIHKLLIDAFDQDAMAYSSVTRTIRLAK